MIRLCRMDDVTPLAALLRQLGYPVEEGSLHERVDRLLARPLVHRVLVVDAPPGDGRGLLGAIHAARREVLESDDHVEISGLIVDERARGTGIGKALVAGAERWARDIGVRAVRVRSNVVRVQAHAFYERLGYHVLKQQVAFSKEL